MNGLRNIIKWTTILFVGFPGREEREREAERLFEEIMMVENMSI